MITLDLDNPASFGAIEGSASLKYQNLAAATLEFQLVCKDRSEPAPYKYKDEIRGTRGGKTMITGVITSCRRELAGNNYAWRVTIKDRWHYLDGSNYLGNGDRSRPEPTISLFPRFRGGLDSKTGTVRLQSTLDNILSTAKGAGCLAEYEINVDEQADIAEFSAAGTYGTMLRTVRSSRPNLIANFDHTGGGGKFIVADQNRAQAVTLDVRGNKITGLNINPLPELIPPAVGIIARSPSGSWAYSRWPISADISQVGCIVTQINLPDTQQDMTADDNKPKSGLDRDCWNFTRPSMMVKGIKLPTDDASARKWWPNKIPLFKSQRWAAILAACKFGVTEKEVVELSEAEKDESYSETATSYEFISGSIAPKCKSVRWCDIIFKQYVYITGKTPPPPEWRHIFNLRHGPDSYGGWLTWRGKTINTARRTYTEGCETTGPEEGDDYPEETEDPGESPPQPDYLGVCKALYETTQILQWGGSLTMLDPPENLTSLVGRTLNITGDLGAMETMQTIIQTIDLDLYSGIASITTGPAEHLSLDDMLERSRALAAQQQQTNANSKNNDDDDDRNGGAGGGTDFQWDPNARKMPKAPTISPGGYIVPGETDPAPEFGFQIKLVRDTEGNVQDAIMRHGNVIMSDGSFMSSRGSSAEDWVSTKITDGQIWIKLSFAGGYYPDSGRYMGMTVVAAGGANVPFYTQIRGEKPWVQAPTYYFHVASIQQNVVTQYVVGSVYIMTRPTTEYPYGPA